MSEYQNFILCYRKPHGINWDCECGYNSVNEVNARTSELLMKNKNLTTTFFPTGYYTPLVFKQLNIQSALSPKITMYKKSSNGERGGPVVLPGTLTQSEFIQIPIPIQRPKNAYY